MKPFITLDLTTAKAPAIRLFTAYTHPEGFTVKHLPSKVLTADELAEELRRLCLNSIDADGNVITGWLDSYEHLPVQFPAALNGGVSWALHVGGYSCNLRIVREVHTRRLQAMFTLHRALFRLNHDELPQYATTEELVARLL